MFGGHAERAGGEEAPDLTPNLVMIAQDGMFFVPSLNGVEAQEITRAELFGILESNGQG